MSKAGKAHPHLNVFKKPIGLFSKDPMTGFYRDGSCNVGPEDKGNHAIAATLNDDFLDFTASKGNNLRSAGLKAGQKWCLCSNRWREAMEAAQSGSASKDMVPRVHLHATHERALDDLKMEDLKKYAAETEAGNASTVPQSTHGGMGGAIKQRTELASKKGMTSQTETPGA